jgi:hypothetical protein
VLSVLVPSGTPQPPSRTQVPLQTPQHSPRAPLGTPRPPPASAHAATVAPAVSAPYPAAASAHVVGSAPHSPVSNTISASTGSEHTAGPGAGPGGQGWCWGEGGGGRWCVWWHVPGAQRAPDGQCTGGWLAGESLEQGFCLGFLGLHSTHVQLICTAVVLQHTFSTYLHCSIAAPSWRCPLRPGGAGQQAGVQCPWRGDVPPGLRGRCSACCACSGLHAAAPTCASTSSRYALCTAHDASAYA